MVVAGWGLVSCPNPSTNEQCTGGTTTKVLQEITLAVASASVCTTADGQDTKANNLFCMGGEKDKTSCFGDSGSGVIYNNNGK